MLISQGINSQSTLRQSTNHALMERLLYMWGHYRYLMTVSMTMKMCN